MSFVDLIQQAMSGQRHALGSTQALTASTTQTDCHNYRLSSTNSCGTVTDRTVYFDIHGFMAVRYEEEERGYNAGDGLLRATFRRKDPYIRFVAVVDDTLESYIQEIQQAAEEGAITFTNLEAPMDYTVRRLLLQPQEDLDVQLLTIEILLEDASQVWRACCGSLFEDAEYDDCDGTGAPSEPAVCSDFAVGIAYDAGGPTLEASTTGGPGGTSTYIWYLDEIGNGVFTQVGTGATINPAVAGIYKVVATSSTNGCTDTAEHTYQGSCVGYEVTLQQVYNVLVATANLLTGTYRWYLDTVLQTTTAVPYLAITEEGDWYVEGETAGGCTDDSNTLAVSLSTDCTWAMSIDDNTTYLTVMYGTPSGDPVTPAIQWWYDDGGGLTELTGETGDSLNKIGDGLYVVYVTQGDCTKNAQFLELGDGCACFRGYINHVEQLNPTTVRLHAASYNAPGDVTYNWYVYTGGQWNHDGVGTTYDLDQEAPVKLIVTSGECTKEDVHLCIDNTEAALYEAWIGTGSEKYETVTAFTVPDPGSLTANEIMAGWQVLRNGIELSYVALAEVEDGGGSETDITKYSWDYANNRVQVPDDLPLAAGEHLAVRELNE